MKEVIIKNNELVIITERKPFFLFVEKGWQQTEAWYWFYHKTQWIFSWGYNEKRDWSIIVQT